MPRDQPRARKLYAQACDGGVSADCVPLGRLLLKRDSDFQFMGDPVRALEAFRKACEGGIAIGCFEQAELLFTGVGAPRDPVRALALYRKACDGGHAPSCEIVKKSDRRR